MDHQLFFYGGLDTVGGVHILFGHGETGILFDAGIAHSGLFRAPFIHVNDPIQPLKNSEIRQLLLSRMAPPILELYKPDALRGLQKENIQSLWNQSSFPTFKKLYVFVSHIHQDHMALLPYLDQQVTVVMHESSYLIYQALIKANYYPDTHANIITFTDQEMVELDNFQLQGLEVDHNVLGSSGFIIRTDEHAFAFTADWRMHGPHPEKMDKFIQTCQQAEIDLLITETTMVNKASLFQKQVPASESLVLENFSKIVSKSDGLVYLMALPLDVERTANLLYIAKQSNREVVMDEKIACFWSHVTKDRNELFHPELAATIHVLTSQKNEIDLPYTPITIEEIVLEKDKYVVDLSFSSLPFLIEFERIGDRSIQSNFIHADAPIDRNIVMKWLEDLEIEYHNISNGGHATHQAITHFIEQVKPKKVIPVHGRFPFLLNSKSIPKIHPSISESISLKTLSNKVHHEIY
ncbi:MBL fold metallo-hydrolase RNA specificity domain-containing protein [Gracilibacillus lacisalsi]|uniref:MBL fold metallo-hydrolase RNA specificity domain-containing protein n=1 Tax=Gracilibacillus lacisalsi TaxID=393087 RepID=UPI0003694D16|nr:MBL fold metallo-hydrolase RNA specificity domain-containing protein [Gracilibacillus lacisalsi]